MNYEPFSRGPYPVGVRTLDLNDDTRGRSLPVEVWYPALEATAGSDLKKESQDTFEVLPGFGHARQQAVRDAAAAPSPSFPLVAFSHGFGGHRRQSTFLCTHLASHGYVVAAVDHTGNTLIDVFEITQVIMAGAPQPDPLALLEGIIRDRPLDISFMIDTLLDSCAAQIGAVIDSEHIGICGHSFGGWTSLTTTATDRRIGAVVPLAPAGGPSPLPSSILQDTLRLDWGREVPTMLLVADRDTLLPLAGMHDILSRTQPPKRMFVLSDADHMHFCDRVEQTHEMFRTMPPPGPLGEIAKKVPPMSELCSGEKSSDFVRGMTLAHMDAVLCKNADADGFLKADPIKVLGLRGIGVTEVS